MKYIFSNQVIDFAMLFLMIWNLWIFIFNKSKKEDLKQPICPIEKEEAIKDAFRYFQMI